MTNPVWVWAIEHRLTGYSLNKAFHGPPSKDVGPCWSFSRYGRTETVLPDGRLVRIGGEYEDHYDADFYIYNDVIVSHPGSGTEILGYSDEVFPPTDFHTANLVDDRIFIVGNLSYPNVRGHKAQVLVLDITNFGVGRFDTTGETPPWIYKHSSELVEDGGALLVRGGRLIGPRWPGVVENIDDWRLDLHTGAGSALPGGSGRDLHSFEMMAVKIISFGFAAAFQIAPVADQRTATAFEPNIFAISAPILE
ncbi:hypothetical protein [Mesorhizobium sp. M0019]|uniref:hypothetical protein n=1 Tax=Mesorhizobium sp. M0019 TaxID=2956845 RepID=UPI0033363DB2